jgi:hypothetical protein
MAFFIILESQQKAWQLTAEHCLNEVRHNYGRNARTDRLLPNGAVKKADIRRGLLRMMRDTVTPPNNCGNY